VGARVVDGRGLAAELEEGLAAEVAGLRVAGLCPDLHPRKGGPSPAGGGGRGG